jgi:SAM-dependent methyltransferase
MSVAPPAPATTVNENSTIYYSGQYWNDLPQVVAYMSEDLTGDPAKWWVRDFQERFCSGPVVNCGNGWVERELVDKGIVTTVAAFDYSWDLLCEAARECGSRAIHYVRADANTVSFAPDSFDVVFNVAALRHVRHLDRLCRVLCEALKPSGVLVNFDYIGPHRNQYSRRHWRRITRVNRRLPAAVVKQPLRRAHLPTRLATDPTKAIHSELILATVARHFDIFERHDTGGGIAYELLTHNPSLHALGPEAADPYVREVLTSDRHYTARGRCHPYSHISLPARRRTSCGTRRGCAPSRTRRIDARRERNRAAACTRSLTS